MLEDQVAFLLQKYLGNYVRGLNKEALKISAWNGDVELTNMQLKPEALNALKLPVKVKAGFLGSVRLKVPWSRLGQEPVLVYLDRIFVLAEPETQVEGQSEDAVQEAKKKRVKEMEVKLLESQQQFKSDVNTSWLGSFINTIIGNLKLSITNIHIRYEDLESNPGHPFAVGVTLAKLSAMTVDNNGKETFVTGGALERIHKNVELKRLAIYFDSDSSPWSVDKPWEKLLPSEWNKVFEVVTDDNKLAEEIWEAHDYVLQPVSGNAKYTKLRFDESRSLDQALQRAVVNLNDVTLCLTKDGYRDMLKLADNFAAFNQRLKYAHYRPLVSVKSDPKSWWKYAYRAVADEMKKASGKLSWEQVLTYAQLRKKYISLYASLLKSDSSQVVVEDNEEIEKLDNGLDIDIIIQWRLLAHQFVEQSTDSHLREQSRKSWWSWGWNGSRTDGNEARGFTDQDWERLNKVIGYKEGVDSQLSSHDKENTLQFDLEVHMQHNASKLVVDNKNCLADLSCESLECSVKFYTETKNFLFKLGSYKLSSPNGLLAESATMSDSLFGRFTYKPFDAQLDWSLVVKASPCYVTYLKDSIDGVITFFKSNAAVSQKIALGTAAAVQMTLEEVKRTAQQQVTKALKDHARFSLDLDIAAPKITIPTDFCPDKSHSTKLLLDFGNLILSTQDYWESDLSDERDMYMQFNMILSDVSAFLIDGDYQWGPTPGLIDAKPCNGVFMPVIDKCGVVVKLEQIQTETPFLPSTRLAVRLPSLGFHFSPACYHRLMQVAKIFQNEDADTSDVLFPWTQADFEGWLSLLSWKGVGNREAVWQQRYLCLVGPFLYVLENPLSKTYKQYFSLIGKQVYHLPTGLTGNEENVLAVCDAGQSSSKVVEQPNVLILRCDTDESRKTWQNRLQGAIYRASNSAAVTSLSEISSPGESTKAKSDDRNNMINLMETEKLFISGALDELRILFSCNYQRNQSFEKILLGQESHLFEFCAIGGQVELSIRGKDMYIGTLLKSLEIEDLYNHDKTSVPRYLARSFKNTNDTNLNKLRSSVDMGKQKFIDNEKNDYDGEDNFFEASDSLPDMNEDPGQLQGNTPPYISAQNFLPFVKISIKPPSFSRITGLLPDADYQMKDMKSEKMDTLDSFVKAQIIIFDQDSSLYKSIDKQVTVTLAMLSFFCHRPTILAIMEFVNAINLDEDSYNKFDETSSSKMIRKSESPKSEDNPIDDLNLAVQEPAVKGLLGKGKSRLIFNLTLNMARAQIFLMNEDGTCLATLSQNNLLTDIKVFPSSFGIKAALGNLKISDDSLPSSHQYFWVCDMRNPGGSSFVELDFSSFSVDDEDYIDFDYSLVGQLSEVRIIYLNRFVQEIASYFLGLASSNSKNIVKLKDQVTNSEKWFTTTEIEGSPALKLDLTLSKPIIVMPRKTDALDYLELDVLNITVQNKFEWVGDKNGMDAVHLDIMTIQVKDINLTVGMGHVSGDSMIQDVKGLSITINRSLRDLLHRVPSIEAHIMIEELKAAMSNKEYRIITECALSNISEPPHPVPPLDLDIGASSGDLVEPLVPLPTNLVDYESAERESWITLKVSVAISLMELSLHSGTTRDASLCTVQATGAWILYKSNSSGDGFLSATLKGFTVIDDREETKDEYRLAIGKPVNADYISLHHTAASDNLTDSGERKVAVAGNGFAPALTMLIVDAKFSRLSTSISLYVQRPQLLVALDFILAAVEFFVPTVRNMLSNEENDESYIMDHAIILHQQIYSQPSSDFSLSPLNPLVVDDERYDHFIYDGLGETLHLKDRHGIDLCDASKEAIIYVGDGKKLQFKNVSIKNGEYLDSCIFLGTHSSYSVLVDDDVFLEKGNKASVMESLDHRVTDSTAEVENPPEFVVELQAIGPELTFYNTSRDVGESSALSTKLLHAQLDLFLRLVMKGDTFELNANALGLKVESNAIRVLEPFDTCVKFTNASGKTKIHVAISDIFMNFSFSILKLLLAVEEDILAFLRMTSKKVTLVCSQFDKVGTIMDHRNNQTYAFWRPRSPPGFAVLGDCLTPLNEPPSKGVIAVNTSFARVKRPVSFKLIWPISETGDIQFADSQQGSTRTGPNTGDTSKNNCSIWFPVAPRGYVAVGCVVSEGTAQPPLSSALCILDSLVSPCALKDCIVIRSAAVYSDLAFWRVENALGSFLPADPVSRGISGKAYELRYMTFGHLEYFSKAQQSSNVENISLDHGRTLQSEKSSSVTSSHVFESVANFRLIWWNQGAASGKKLSIWRPVVPPGMVYLGDIALQGYDPPRTSVVLHDMGDESLMKAPLGFQLVGHIRKHKGTESVSFWFPQAPPGFVALGCVAFKGTPKLDDFGSLRCIRSDMVTGDQFSEESVWDTSEIKLRSEPFSLWTSGKEVGTFIVRNGFRRPPKRFAIKLADPNPSSGTYSIVIAAQIQTFSAVLFDDYGGLMVPLLNLSFSGIGFSLHERSDYLDSTMSFSLAARSYNDKYDSWEPLVEPMDGFIRYQYDLNAPGATSQLRITSTRDMNMNVSVSNANMVFQAYSSWCNLSHVPDSYIKRETVPFAYDGRSIIDVRHRRNYYIVPLNKLGRDLYIRATEMKSIYNIIKLPSGDVQPVKVPVSKTMLDSHLNGTLKQTRSIVTIIIGDAELPVAPELLSHQYTAAIHLCRSQDIPNESLFQGQSARTCGVDSELSSFSRLASVTWNETFTFKVDSPDCYNVKIIVADIGKGEPVGIYYAPLNEIASSSNSYDPDKELHWRKLSSPKYTQMAQEEMNTEFCGRLRCGVILSVRSEVLHDKQVSGRGSKSGFIQISPAKEGPWTTVRLNYAAPAACWRLGNDVVASEVNVKDGNRYVEIRSLVRVTNNTDFVIDLRLDSKARTIDEQEVEEIGNHTESDEFFEMEKYNPSIGWINISTDTTSFISSNESIAMDEPQGISRVELPSGWEWIDDWHVDTMTVNTGDGWVYAPDPEHLRWPDSHNHINSVNYARGRRWIRHRKQFSTYVNQEISVGLLKPGETLPLPLSSLTHTSLSYILHIKPVKIDSPNEHSWSTVLDNYEHTENLGASGESSEICVSNLTETEKLLYCSRISGNSMNKSRGLWFCLSVKATEIGKDIQSDPIYDWNLFINSPLCLTNFLPFTAQYSVLHEESSGQLVALSEGVFSPGETVKVYDTDLRNPLHFSLLPRGGWRPAQEPILISHSSKTPSKTMSIRSSFSGRITQIILEQNLDKEFLTSRIIRVYAPYWIASARCPSLTYRFIDISGRRERQFSLFSRSNDANEKILWQITEEEMLDGCTIASAVNFKTLGLSLSLGQHGEQQFGPVGDLSSLGDMDGSVDLYAYDGDGNCLRIFISSKPCPYQAVPTKVISVRPYMTFTNRMGRDIFIKFSDGEQPKILHAYDARVAFVHCRTGSTDKFQIRLEDTNWCFPIEITKEDTITLVLKLLNGGRRFLRAEIRGYEEGSRFLIVFRLASARGPISIENRTGHIVIEIRQSGLLDGAWIQLQPLSTVNFSWENPYGCKLLDVRTQNGVVVQNVSLEKSAECSTELQSQGIHLHIIEMGEMKVARFIVDQVLQSHSNGYHESTSYENVVSSQMLGEVQNDAVPLELIVELGVVGISVIDHRPKELLYLYLERVFISYSTGYDGGNTSRFKLILGHLQLDNQLPLTLMPVLLAPEQTSDLHHPVFKTTITMSNANTDGTQVFPYVYIRVTESRWRLNVHEPIIWALIEFYNKLHMERIPSSSNVTQVDPEIRIDLIDVSEVRLKLSFETAPTQRPHGVLGIWSPILSAVGNAFRIQLHLRKVMHRNRFMRKSAIIPAITNRIWRDLIHNPLHLIFSVDVLGMTSSTLASLSKGFAELSTDGQFLHLRSKQVWSRRITGVRDGILQGTEALAQGVAFGVSGVLTKPVESTRQHGILGLAHGLGRAFVGFVVQPVSGALDFVSLTVDGIGASFTRCLGILNNKTPFHRIRNPRAIHANGLLKEYCEREAMGQMILYLAEASRCFGCTDIFKEPSKYAWSDYYECHFNLPNLRILLLTDKRVMLLQCLYPDKMDKKPCKITWDVPWEELMALELAKAGYLRPSCLILHLKNFKKMERFVQLIKCNVEDDVTEQEPQAVRICAAVQRMWRTHKSDMRTLTLKVPSSQRHVQFAWDEAGGSDSYNQIKPMIKPRGFDSVNSLSDERRFIKHSVNFQKIWSSELESRTRCTLCPKQVMDDGTICSIWRPLCPDGYVSIGDIAHVGVHPPNVAAIYHDIDGKFALPVGYDLVWRNRADDYVSPVSIWLPRAPEGYISIGCVGVGGFEEPHPSASYCVRATLSEETVFEEQTVWTAPGSFPWACYVYQVQSEALHFVALRQPKEESEWKPMRVPDSEPPSSSNGRGGSMALSSPS